MLTLIQRISETTPSNLRHTLPLTAEERTRCRRHLEPEPGLSLYLNLPRGTVLQHGDILVSAEGDRVQILAKPEPVLTVTAHHPLDLLRAAYHLGNRHVPLEVTQDYLRLSPDPVLQDMLHHMGLHVHLDTVPFHPETGAYGSSTHHAH
ncbi:MAG: urease accessory protein UreE [Synechococcales cyanobacterium K44_A2020_017]|jgi:urease accessory protein|nr:urease accessory protein UreE [Synechococcales cyanobacterium K32_A2020_035]MBF2093282.1 urease accessory protein UreE [Synechococcales cyanobacterium K44_A2020_017]